MLRNGYLSIIQIIKKICYYLAFYKLRLSIFIRFNFPKKTISMNKFLER